MLYRFSSGYVWLRHVKSGYVRLGRVRSL